MKINKITKISRYFDIKLKRIINLKEQKMTINKIKKIFNKSLELKKISKKDLKDI